MGRLHAARLGVVWAIISGGVGLGGCAQNADSPNVQGATGQLAEAPAPHAAASSAAAPTAQAHDLTPKHTDQAEAQPDSAAPEAQQGAAAGTAAVPSPREVAAQPSAAVPAQLAAAQPPAEAHSQAAQPTAAGQAEDCSCADGDQRKAQLGEKLFNDRSLSASGTLSCAGCHSDAQSGTGNNTLEDPLFPVSHGAFPNLVGNRNAPTTRYAAFSPAFSIVPEVEAGETEYTPVGGQFWDGRADTLAAQAGGPFLNPREMALPDKQSVVERVRAAEYAPLFGEVFGGGALDDVDHAYAQLTEAIEAFEKTHAFAPFDSKFDAVLRGEAELSAEEARGFALFKDPQKGNCLACHAGLEDSHDPHDWLFTDFTYDNIGVPRNARIADNDDPTFYDLGLCKQAGLRERVPAPVADPDAYVEGLCGAFKVPTLRNVARTAPYMHNGYFTDLRAVVDFYATRDTDPGKWFPCDDSGYTRKFDDVPEALRANVNTSEAPMDRTQGDAPRLAPDEIDAIVTFLTTLSDGYL